MTLRLSCKNYSKGELLGSVCGRKNPCDIRVLAENTWFGPARAFLRSICRHPAEAESWQIRPRRSPMQEDVMNELRHEIHSPLAALRNALYLIALRCDDFQILEYVRLAEGE